MAQIIAVPIHLDALYVNEPGAVATAMADFTRLPYFDGQRDINAESPWLGETAASEPFGNTTVLKKGIHLHWRFPKGLTTGIQSAGDKIRFPNLPDRWLIVRGHDTDHRTVEAQWVIESNYLHPEGETGEGAAYPIEPNDKNATGRRYRYLGHCEPLNQWLRRSSTSGEYLSSPLTAVGYGEPTYASFYPNCSQQFGFHDPQFHDQTPSGLYYQVIGWYSDPTNDWIQFLKDQAGSATSFSRILTERLGLWVPGIPTPGVGIVCHGSLIFRNRPDAKLEVKLTNPAVAVGATMTEALSAYLANEVAAGDLKTKAMLEDKLEAIMLDRKLSTRTVDLAAKFKEARHEKGFDEVYGGILWTVRAEASPNEQPDASPAAPWPDVAEKLDALNRLQNAYQLAWDEIRSLRARLYSNWCRYMRLSHSPRDPAKTLNISEAYRLIELQLREIDRKIADVGNLDLNAPRKAHEPLPFSETKPNSLAGQISKLFLGILDSLRTHESELEGKLRYRIQPAVAPRYWSPTEPVILLTGKAPRTGEPLHVDDIDAPTRVTASDGGLSGRLAAGTYQYSVTALNGAGGETLLAASNPLAINGNRCINLTWGAVGVTTYNVYRYVSPTSGYLIGSAQTNSFTDDGSITPASTLTGLVALSMCELLELGDIKTELRKQGRGSELIRRFPFKPREWKDQPWHPLLLQWEVELTPFLGLANLTTPDGNYDESFVSKNFAIKCRDADLSPLTVAGKMDAGQPYQLPQDAFVYRGSSLLTPHAADQFLAECYQFLERLEAQEPDVQEETSNGDPLGSPVIGYVAPGDEFRSQTSIEYLIKQLKRYKFGGLQLETLNKLGEVLKDLGEDNFFCLAQRLSGFNQALLIHHQTLGIPIRDPLGFEEDRSLANDVEHALLGGAYPAPQPGSAFCPIRAGELRVKRLRVVSTFGRHFDFDFPIQPIVTATPMRSNSGAAASVFLSPRPRRKIPLPMKDAHSFPFRTGKSSSSLPGFRVSSCPLHSKIN